MDDLEWPFCVKICLGLGIEWVGMYWLSDKTLEIYRAMLILSAAEM